MLELNKKKWEAARKRVNSTNLEVRQKALHFTDSVLEDFEIAFRRGHDGMNDCKKPDYNSWTLPELDYGRYAALCVCAIWGAYWTNKRMQYITTGEADIDGYDSMLHSINSYINKVKDYESLTTNPMVVKSYNQKLSTHPLNESMLHVCEHPFLNFIIPTDND